MSAFHLHSETIYRPSAEHPTAQIFPSIQVRNAGTIFSGRVVSVRAAPESGITLLTVRVETAIRGARTGQLLTIREWQGSWNNGERYAPGERVLLFLYPKSKLGLTSAVGGPFGRYRIDRLGRVLISDGVNLRGKPVPLLRAIAEIRQMERR
jgi:hypothetical protein